jgi:hypothetical protein
MRYLKFLSFAGLVVVAIFLAVAAPSSATTLCKTTTTPCGSVYKKESVINLSMSGRTVLSTTEGQSLSTCTSGGAEVKITQAGGQASNASGDITSQTWSECSATTDTISKGALSIEHITGTDNGTVTGSGTEVTVIFEGSSCVYGTNAGTHLGTLKGREKSVIEIDALLAKDAGGLKCPTTAIWRAKYEPSEALYVEPGNGPTWCETTTTPCGSSYKAGATFKASVSGSAVLETLEGSLLGTCSGGALKGVVTTDGGEVGAVSVPIESLTWSSCTITTTTVRAGEFDFTPISGTDNAKVAYSGTEVTYVMFGVSCGYGSDGSIGTLKGGEKPIIEVKEKLPRFAGSFLCPKEVRWTAEYKVEEPTPLYVETS